MVFTPEGCILTEDEREMRAFARIYPLPWWEITATE
jgi:hypothetical protein